VGWAQLALTDINVNSCGGWEVEEGKIVKNEQVWQQKNGNDWNFVLDTS
jgi:hypothetical protein